MFSNILVVESVESACICPVLKHDFGGSREPAQHLKTLHVDENSDIGRGRSKHTLESRVRMVGASITQVLLEDNAFNITSASSKYTQTQIVFKNGYLKRTEIMIPTNNNKIKNSK